MRARSSTYVCFLMTFLAALLMTVIGPMLSVIEKDFSISLSQSGLLYTAEFVGFFILIIICGTLSDKLGKRAVLTRVFLLLAVSLFLFSVSKNFMLSLIIMLFAGGGCGPLNSLISSVLSDLNPEAVEKYIALNAVFFGLGAASGPVIAGFMLTYGVSWRIVYLGLSAISIVMLFVSFLIKIPRTEKSGEISIPALKTIFKDWRFMLACVSMFLYCGAEATGWGWMSEFMKEKLNFTILKSSLAIGVFWISISVGRALLLPVIKRVNIRIVIGFLSVFAAASTIASALVSGEMFAWLLIILMGLFYSGVGSLIIAQSSKRHIKYSGTSVGLLNSFGGISMAVIPAVLGVVTENFGVFVAQLIPAFLFILVLITYCFIAKPDKT